uniref:(California timema) hypothetical protein n=1 Tax=Timema californicum TaxID=61474 RepID=A0A7R9J6Q5_TIMCA|nr:unnamed protein product [Timema californicum]
MCASVCSASESPIDFSPKLQLDESSQKEDSLSSGNNNSDHNKLDNIEGQTSVKLQQIVNEPNIDPCLENDKMTYITYVSPGGSIHTSPSDTFDTIKEREDLEKYSTSDNKDNIHVSPEFKKPEEWCGPNNEPPSFSYSDSSNILPPLPICCSLFEHNPPYTGLKKTSAKTLLSTPVESFKDTSSAQDDVFDILEERVESSNINLRDISNHQIGYCFGTSHQALLDQNIKAMKIKESPKNTASSADKEMEAREENLIESISSSSIIPKSTSEGNMDFSSDDFGDPNFGTRV